MKISLIALLICTFLGRCTQKKDFETKFYVRGNCEMCKERIEEAAYNVRGVTNADWNVETKEITLHLDTLQSTILEVHKAIAETGHSTNLVEMDKKAHEELPECCQVEESDSTK